MYRLVSLVWLCSLGAIACAALLVELALNHRHYTGTN